jgi:hypothetical protein
VKRIGVLALIAAALCTADLSAQRPGAGSGLRVGAAVGGIATCGLGVAWFDDARSLEVALGTWSFRDLSVSTVVKQYFGAGAAQPFVGAGLWLVTSRPDAQRRGLAAVLRAPIGLDWGVADDHSVGFALNVNRAIGVRRSDPADELPMAARFVPLPELHYKYTR